MTRRSAQEAHGWRRPATIGPYRSISRLAVRAVLGLLALGLGGGCFGESGITPPNNRILLPDGLVVDPDDGFVYVVNSNSDLRYNAGTIVAVNLPQAALVRSCARDPGQAQCAAAASSDPNLANLASAPPMCTKTRFSISEDVPDNYCCVDLVDSNILNCYEAQFIYQEATVQVGSFAGAVALLSYQRNGVPMRRLFTAVRAEPSITFVDATVSGATVSMRCTGDPAATTPPPPNAFCADNWRVRRPDGATPGQLVLPEEPHTLWLDPTRRALFVGHLTVTANTQVQGGGVSSLDICNIENGNPVAFAGLAHTPFLPATLAQAVAGLSGPDPQLPSSLVYATAFYSSAVGGMVLGDPTAATCDQDSATPRDLTLVPSDSFYAPAFLPNGVEVRAILFSATPSPRAFVLNSNDSNTAANPAAISVLDRTLLSDGKPSNQPLALIQMCNGPTGMQMHNTGGNDLIYVTCYDDGEVYVVDPVALQVTAVIDVGPGPVSLVFPNHDPNTAYIASFANSNLAVIDIDPTSPTYNRVTMRIGLPHPYGQ